MKKSKDFYQMLLLLRQIYRHKYLISCMIATLIKYSTVGSINMQNKTTHITDKVHYHNSPYTHYDTWQHNKQYSLPGSDHIESEPHCFPVWLIPLEHIHLSGCLVAQFQPVSTGLLHWLASGILWRLCMHCLALGSVYGHVMISPRLVLRTQPQNSIMPMLLLLWYLRLLPISNWTTFLVDCCGWPPSSLYCACAPCSLACNQE